MRDQEHHTLLDEGEASSRTVLSLTRPLRFLNERHIARIDRALADIGPYGEVRLIKAKGRLRFIQWLDSEDAI